MNGTGTGGGSGQRRGAMADHSTSHRRWNADEVKEFSRADLVMGIGIPLAVVAYLIFLYCLITKVRKARMFMGGDKAGEAAAADRFALAAMEAEVRRHHKEILVKDYAVQVEHSKMLGAGQFSAVFLGYLLEMSRDPAEPKAVYKKKQAKVAVKQVNQQTPANHTALLKEGRELSELAHPNILRLRGICLKSPFGPMLITEYLDGGSLKSHLDDVRSGYLTPFSYAEAQRLLVDVASAVEFLHSKDHVHRDIAARNVLLSSRNLAKATVKLADFGLAQDQAYYEMQNPYRMLPVAGMTPEVFLYQIFCPQSDVWAFGILVWEVFAVGAAPLEGLGMEEIQRRVTSSQPRQRHLPIASTTPKPLAQLMRKCWGLAYGTRPPMSTIRVELMSLRLPSAAVPIPHLPISYDSSASTTIEESPVPTDPEPGKSNNSNSNSNSVHSLANGAKLADAYPERTRTNSEHSFGDARPVPMTFQPTRHRQTSEGYETPLNASRSSSVATVSHPYPPPSISSDEYFALGGGGSGRSSGFGGGGPLATSSPNYSNPPIPLSRLQVQPQSAAHRHAYYNAVAVALAKRAEEEEQRSEGDTIDLDETLAGVISGAVDRSGRGSSSSGVSSLPYMHWRSDLKSQRGAYI